MQALLISVGTVFLGEIGDKTQLLAIVLASRFRRPWQIIAGILVATIANHLLAGIAGAWIARTLTPEVLRWAVGLSFIAIGIWALRPDRLEISKIPSGDGHVLRLSAVAFFLAEMGDKTQVATAVLAAKYGSLWQVVPGSVIGMLLADIPAVFLSSALAERLPLRAIRMAAAASFLLLGGLSLIVGGVSLPAHG
jgi:putative Ca2+/H+ antiporter (TMEM165/GDT1 family)